MTKVTFYCDENDKPFGFTCEGHAGFDKFGKDIVCAAISVLTINFINSVEKLTNTACDCIAKEKEGSLKVTIKDYEKADVALLFESLRLGLNGIQEEYPKNLKLTNRRCKP